MRNSGLELRSWTTVGIGYLISPVFGLTALWLIYICEWASNPPTDWGKATALWALMLLVGGPACVAVELVFVTPILFWFRRFRWRWLNGWTGAAIGFVLGAGCWLALGLLPSRDLDGLVVMRVAHESVGMGAVGLVTAIVFRLIAFRTVPLGTQAHVR